MNEKNKDFFRSAHPRPATSKLVTKNFREEKIILLLRTLMSM